jgi:hypothetical protein
MKTNLEELDLSIIKELKAGDSIVIRKLKEASVGENTNPSMMPYSQTELIIREVSDFQGFPAFYVNNDEIRKFIWECIHHIDIEATISLSNQRQVDLPYFAFSKAGRLPEL